MHIRDGIFTTVAVAVSGILLAVVLCTDAYSRAASAEARGFHALSLEMQMSCAGECAEVDERIVQLQAKGAIR
jgi:tagatose-1,6-bisphosphate aldolase non-catalytic subunit AgaZ/GatZ